MSEDPPTEADRFLRDIDRARQKQAAHTVGCYPVMSGASRCGNPDCAECARLQRRLDELYHEYGKRLKAAGRPRG